MRLRKTLLRLSALAVLCLLAAAVLTSAPGAAGDDEDDVTLPPSLPEKAPPKYPNMTSMLNGLVERLERGVITAESAASSAPLHDRASVAVTIYLSEGLDGVASFLERSGVSIRNKSQSAQSDLESLLQGNGVSGGNRAAELRRMLSAGDIDGVRALLRSGPSISGASGYDYVEAYVPVTLLGQLSEQPGVIRVQPIAPPHPGPSEHSSTTAARCTCSQG